MADTTHTSRPWWKWLALGLLGLILLLLLAFLGLYLWLRSDSGLSFVESQIEGRQLGPIAGAEVDGLSGNLFDGLTIDRLVLRDRNGEWLIIEDLRVDYTILSLRTRHVDLQDLAIDKVTVLRRPELEEVEEGEPFRLTIEQFAVNTLDLEEPVIGQTASLTTNGAFVLKKSGRMDVELRAERLDSPGETLVVDLDRSRDGQLSGQFDLEAPAGGAIPALIRAPDDVPVSGTGTLAGTVAQGEGALTLQFGTQDVVNADVSWTEQTLGASGNARAGAWPMLEAVTSRIGQSVDFNLAMRRDERTFTARLDGDDLTLSASGDLPEDSLVPEGADIDLVSTAPMRLLGLPEGYRMGRLQATGRATTDLAFDGNVAVTAFTSPYFDAGTIRAPVKLSRQENGTFDISTDARLRELITKQALPVDLANEATVRTVFRLNPEMQVVVIDRFTLTSGPQSLTTSGRVRLDGETPQLDLEGRADVRINQMGSVPPGALIANFDVQTTADLPLPAVTAEGSFQPSDTLPGPLSEIIGEKVNFDVAMTVRDDQALRITRGNIATENLNAAILGAVGDTLDIEGEARVLNTLTLPQATIAENAQASFTVTGARTDPSIRVDAALPGLTASGRTLEDVRLRADVTNLLTNPRGPVQIDAQTEYGPLTASADLASENGLYAASDIQITLAELTARGDVNVVEGNLYAGRLTLDLPQDGAAFAKAELVLEPRAGVQGVDLAASAKTVSVMGYDIETFDANLSGTLEQLTGQISLKGREDALLARQLVLDTPLTVTRQDNRYTATLSPEGEFGALRFEARSPVTLSYADGAISAELDMSINAGTLQLTYARRDSAETLNATFDAIPLQTFPLPLLVAETQGQISGTADFASSVGTAPSGTFNARLSDWRGREVEAGEGISLIADGTLFPDRLRLRLEDGDKTPFDIQGQARIPLIPANTLTGLRLNPDAPLTARFDADGDAAVIFNLFAPEDSEPSGQLDVDVVAGGTLSNITLTGSAGGDAINFEAPVAGTTIRNGRFRAEFTRTSVTISDFYAEDRRDGRLTGQGQFRLADSALIGELNIDATDFRAIDRRDYEGRMSGKIGYVATAADQTVTGDLTIDNAEVKQFAPGGARVVNLQIDNVIGERDNQSRIRVPRQALPIGLDVKVRAPRKIFIRARGIDLEAALDIRIAGTISEPLIYGEAEVLRGGLTIAGKQLEFDEGTIDFNGPIPTSRIRMEATATTPTLTAKVEIKGTVTEPEIELSSTPERPEDEILSALLFGRSATQLTALEAAQLAGAVAQLSGSGGGFDLVGGLRDALGFSSLDIGVDAEGSPVLSGGRYLASNVYLELFSGTQSSATGAVISWEVRPNVVLRTAVASDNEQAFAVLYERDF